VGCEANFRSVKPRISVCDHRLFPVIKVIFSKLIIFYMYYSMDTIDFTKVSTSVDSIPMTSIEKRRA
jgi:hypothetical protein